MVCSRIPRSLQRFFFLLPRILPNVWLSRSSTADLVPVFAVEFFEIKVYWLLDDVSDFCILTSSGDIELLDCLLCLSISCLFT